MIAFDMDFVRLFFILLNFEIQLNPKQINIKEMNPSIWIVSSESLKKFTLKYFL
jgi:hypothetical protein